MKSMLRNIKKKFNRDKDGTVSGQLVSLTALCVCVVSCSSANERCWFLLQISDTASDDGAISPGTQSKRGSIVVSTSRSQGAPGTFRNSISVNNKASAVSLRGGGGSFRFLGTESCQLGNYMAVMLAIVKEDPLCGFGI